MVTAKYREEIDGLRAIAVLFVISFHFFPSHVPLGFLGVDLFFVISGYVITAQIHALIRNGQFTFRDFYRRRIRRILPLSFVVIAVVGVAGRLILLPADFNRMAEAMFASATFWSNVYFWLDGGYFGTADKLKPLLHMWSLSVEEQFYIFYPLVLWTILGVMRFRFMATAVALLALTAASFALYFFLLSIGGRTPAFFFMPTRAWQFGLGALAALAVSGGLAGAVHWLAASAFAILVASFFIASPLFVNELAVAGAAAVFLVVSVGLPSAVRPLSTAPLKWAGLRSFSLYLWHWPIVAFLNYYFVESIPLSAKLAGIALCVALSEASYRLVETPFRYRLGLRSSVSLIAATSIGMVALVFSAGTGGERHDLSHQLALQSQTNFRCSIFEFTSYGASRACVLQPLAESGNVAILGNSHAQMYAPAISSHFEDGPTGVLLVPLNSCLPTVSLNISRNCLEQASINLETLLADQRIASVVIGTTYDDTSFIAPDGGAYHGEAPVELASALIDLIDQIEASGRTAWLIGPNLGPGYNLPDELGRKLRFGQVTEAEAEALLSVPRGEFDRRFAHLISLLQARLGDRLLLPHEKLCDVQSCYFANADGGFFADSNHLGRFGVATVSPIFNSLH